MAKKRSRRKRQGSEEPTPLPNGGWHLEKGKAPWIPSRLVSVQTFTYDQAGTLLSVSDVVPAVLSAAAGGAIVSA